MGTPERPVSILVVDDEEPVRRFLKTILVRSKYRVLEAANGDEALDRAVDQPPDLVILDLTLAGPLGGLQVCQQLRTWLAAPILILSGHGNESLKIQAVDLGADDYLTKPFGPGELLARIRALRRRVSSPPAPSVLAAGELKIDLAHRRVWRGEREIRLTRTEFDILACLAQDPDCVVITKNVIEKVWGAGHGGGSADPAGPRGESSQENRAGAGCPAVDPDRAGDRVPSFHGSRRSSRRRRRGVTSRYSERRAIHGATDAAFLAGSQQLNSATGHSFFGRRLQKKVVGRPHRCASILTRDCYGAPDRPYEGKGGCSNCLPHNANGLLSKTSGADT